MPDTHALLGPSSAHRWLVCPPSARLCEKVPETPSPDAEKGRLAHEIAELKLRKWIEPTGPRTYTAKLNKLKKSEYFEPDMLENTEVYMDFIKSVANGMSKCEVRAETRVDYSQYVPEGFGTADCIILGDGILHVVDYKNGSGVPVDTDDNPQLKLYGLGAYLDNFFIYGIEKIRVSVVQPKLNREVKTWETTPEELLGLISAGGGR